jgi:hypothetical protein
MGVITPVLPLIAAIDKETLRTHPFFAVVLAGGICSVIVIHAQRKLIAQRSTLERIVQGYSAKKDAWIVMRAFLIMIICILFVLFGIYFVIIGFYS